MGRERRAGTALTCLRTLAGLILLPAALLPFASRVSADEPVVVAIDADTTGNSARVAGAVDDCVSTSVGERFDVDVALPAPGIPAAKGISGYQFQFYYDLRVVSVQNANDDMLLTQAPGSNLIPFSDVTPNTTGEYLRVAADFGRSGIEPQGTSETGPGVIARLTLRAEATGESPLGLRDVRLVADGSTIYGNLEVRTGTVHVGSSCPAASVSPSPELSATIQTTQTPAPGAPGTATPAAAQVSGGGPAGGPAAGVGALSPKARGAALPMVVWLAMVGLGITGIAAARRLLMAPVWGSTCESFQKKRPCRAVLKRRSNKDC